MKESYERITEEGQRITYAIEYSNEEKGIINVFRSKEHKKIRVKCGSTTLFIKENDCITAPGGASGLYNKLADYIKRDFCTILAIEIVDFAIDQMKEV